MYFLIPLILITGSAVGIGYIVWPKVRQVKGVEKLPKAEGDFWRLMFPELFGVVEKIDLKAKKDEVLLGYEKFLRRLRILSLKTDNVINKLLEKRPKVEQKAEFKEVLQEEAVEANGASIQFKAKENHLISEIAKNPKDKNLYKALGTLYMGNKMLADARESFNVVLELDPNDSEAKTSLEEMAKIENI